MPRIDLVRHGVRAAPTLVLGRHLHELRLNIPEHLSCNCLQAFALLLTAVRLQFNFSQAAARLLPDSRETARAAFALLLAAVRLQLDFSQTAARLLSYWCETDASVCKRLQTSASLGKRLQTTASVCKR